MFQFSLCFSFGLALPVTCLRWFLFSCWMFSVSALFGSSLCYRHGCDSDRLVYLIPLVQISQFCSSSGRYWTIDSGGVVWERHIGLQAPVPVPVGGWSSFSSPKSIFSVWYLCLLRSCSSVSHYLLVHLPFFLGSS